MARLKERSIEQWIEIFQRIDQSSFCRGQNERQWRASFDWIIANQGNSIKVLEGKYDDRTPPADAVAAPTDGLSARGRRTLEAGKRYLATVRHA